MSIVTVTAFQYRLSARFQAFANMGRVLMQPPRINGLNFGKLMGTGINYGLIPDLSTYVFVGVWDEETDARAFSQTDLHRHLSQGTQQISTLYLQPQRTHGLWDGQNPFNVPKEPQTTDYERRTTAPVAVLTRATIRPRALPDFWRHVPQARQRLIDHADDLVFGVGVGEIPLVQQCTITVWRDAAAVNRYAYQQSGHREVVRLTRERNWYTEELFARFSVLRAEGSLFAPVERLVSQT